ncbi:HTTM domain-containing protein [Limnofasciculus baicalensis]|uniref:HTTM domain-containing protein n=1 Tax=Limnofasciculus baicalensis BBK-W-15 TaxID=2699891 RepID=A0AAE3H0B7_9CYAN|nr:HTTM domain-containing protein [Limnofasciculus baicalensis]MCP2731917.1 HTTM domain-containing protein [Limnofasciculus baicalensis BBK-W-15]
MSWLKKLEELFGLDLRSLALMRICLAILIIVDLIKRSQDLAAHYTDFGILPRGPLIEQFLNPLLWSFHLFSGKSFFEAILFILAGLVALVLLIGYQTRLFTILSWILLVSLQNRNPIILDGGDIELHLLLFWGIFLPLGAYYSVDSALNSSEKPLPTRILSPASVALILQVCLVYWVSAILKSDPVWWKEGSAAYYALSIDQLATPLGHFLLNFPGLLTISTFITIWIEACGPFLLFVPIATPIFRIAAVVIFISLHGGFGLTLTLDLFPVIAASGWLACLPSEFWDGISAKLQTPQRQGLRIYYDGDCGFCKKMVYIIRTCLILPETPLLPAQDNPEIFTYMKTQNSWVVVDWKERKHFKFEAISYICSLSPLFFPIVPLLKWQPIMSIGTNFYEWVANNRRTASKVTTHFQFRPLEVQVSYWTNAIALSCLVCILLWNLNTIAPSLFKLPNFVTSLSFSLRLDQRWDMFAPNPLVDDGWYVIPGYLKDGTEIDVFNHGKPVTWEKPALVADTYPNGRWRKYMLNFWYPDNARYRPYYGGYLCRDWNSQHQGGKQLDRFNIYFMKERTLPNYQPPKVEKVFIMDYYCFELPKVEKK